jgi:hypothetical protein
MNRLGSSGNRHSIILGLGILATVLSSRECRAQVQDQIVIYAQDPVTFQQQMARYDRQLHWLSTTTFPFTNLTYQGDEMGIACDAQGQYWIPWDTLYQPLALIMSPLGAWLPSITCTEYPLDAVAGPSGNVYLRTRIPLSAPGPIYCVKPDGTFLWVSWDAVTPFNSLNGYPRAIAVATGGDVYVGGESKGLCGCMSDFGAIARVDPQTGLKIATINIPKIGTGAENVWDLEADPDGGIWAFMLTSSGFRFCKIQGSTIVNQFAAQGGYNGGTYKPRIDGNGFIYGVSWNTGQMGSGGDILKMSPVDGSILATYPIGRTICGLALGPGGDEIFAISGGVLPDLTARFFDRVNLVTGVHSSLEINPQFLIGSLPGGDPTGFLYSNIVDPAGDADGDGVPNGIEVAAGSNPYDPTSVPWGPKVYLSWTTAGGVRLQYKDPDGLLSPTRGIVALDLQVEGFGDILPYLVPFVTYANLSPDTKVLTIECDGWPVPQNLRLRFTARAMDATGAIGSDWAVSPPGQL